jgi:hypothetical protein
MRSVVVPAAVVSLGRGESPVCRLLRVLVVAAGVVAFSSAVGSR